MNATADLTSDSPSPAAAPHATHAFKLLVKREFWEHKGGFFWAPLVAGGIALTFAVLGAIGGTFLGRKHGNDFTLRGGEQEIAQALGAVGDVSFLSGLGIAAAVLGFVVFFYSLGCLYDDRKDRSILFWKSLPVSDSATVLVKVLWALVLAPVIAVAVGVVIGLGLWAVGLVTTSVNGLPGASGILTHSHPLRITANVIAVLPVYALWALPTVGWLMLCSAAARSKPFLWAVMIPVIGCALVSMTDLFAPLNIASDRLWYIVAYRGLLSVFPGTWLQGLDVDVSNLHGPEDLPRLIDAAANWSMLGSADLWIGVAAGAAMIAAAIRLRRWRDEG